MKKVQNLTLIALVFLFIIPSVIQLGSNTVATNIELSKDYIESYTHHDQIWIQSNAEFHAQATAESWAGDGSEENPYIITGYYFDCETQPLRIWHTTVHWIFTGNEIFGVGAAIECGTWVEDATNGAITNNEIHNRHAGIAIADIADFTISENYIHDCWGRGVELFGTMNNTIIKNNVIQNIGQSGIYSVGSRDCIVENNTISYCDNNGISLLTTTVNCIVTDNTILNCDSAGILMANIEGGSVTDNTISEVED
ncbi:MAG: right-handed parallel beta-helix repeat-containing protein, partial [Candidatus Thorarchaeota archaeon]